MRIVDLSHPIEANMNVFPGDPIPDIAPLAVMERDGYRTKRISLCTHTGTHIDAPAHMIADGVTLDKMPCERFFGTALMADIHTHVGLVEFTDLDTSAEELASADFLILYTGYGEKWQSKGYLNDFPILSRECVSKLVAAGLKGIGVDTISVDPVTSEDCAIHKILLSSGLVILENLCNLHRLPYGKPFRIAAFPLPIKGADGAPARIVAIV